MTRFRVTRFLFRPRCISHRGKASGDSALRFQPDTLPYALKVKNTFLVCRDLTNLCQIYKFGAETLPER